MRKRNRGAYGSPFSGVGIEFYPLGVTPDHSGVVLHEVGFLPRNDWWVFPNVFSPFWRLYYNFRPGHKVIFPDREVPITPRHIMVIPERCLFHCEGRTAVPNLWLAFSVARRLVTGTRVPLLLKPSPTELFLLRAIAGLIGRRHAERESAYFAGLALLRLVLGRPEIRWAGGVIPEGVRRALRLIEVEYGARLAIPALAEEAAMSVRGFTAAFRRACGKSPARYVTEVRVREASHLLLETDESIDAIAARTGFLNRHHFSRVFKGTTGESPAMFRHRHGEGALARE
ncbi:MAG TPA: AraC family transcriptional regulator [Verrucomicrobiae bacterium]|nr:AraC family transcriptional regulator [Verrucomicrobiae bacterium]